jgi:hypothetical protein
MIPTVITSGGGSKLEVRWKWEVVMPEVIVKSKKLMTLVVTILLISGKIQIQITTFESDLPGKGVTVFIVDVPTIIVVLTDEKYIVVSVGMVDEGITNVHGGQQPNIGLGVSKIS